MIENILVYTLMAAGFAFVAFPFAVFMACALFNIA